MTASKRGLRWALIGGAVLLVLVLGLLLVPFLVPVDRFRPLIVRLAEESTGRRVEIDALHFHLLPTIHLQVVNLHVKNPAGFPDGDALIVKSLDVGTTLSSVLARRLDVTGLTFNGVEANLLQTPRGTTNYDFSGRLGKPVGAPSPRGATERGFSVSRIDYVVARGVKITSGTYDPASRKVLPLFAVDGFNARAGAINLGAPNWTDSVDVVGDLGGILFSNPALTKPLHIQKGNFTLKGGAVQAAFTAALDTLRVDCNVKIANIKDPMAEFAVSFPELDVDKLEALAAAGTRGGTPVPPGGPRRLLAKGDIKIGKVIATPAEAGPVTARLTVYTDRADINPYSLAAFGGTVRGTAMVDYAAPHQPLEISAQARGVDLGAVMKATGRAQPAITGKLDADAHAMTALAPDPLAALKVTVDSYTLAAFDGIIRGTAAADYGAPGQPVRATAQARGVNLTKAMNALAPSTQFRIGGTADVDARIETRLRHDPMAALKVTVDSYTLAAFDGVIRGTAAADYGAPGQPVRATAQARGVNLGTAMNALAPSTQFKIGGTADVDGRIETRLRQDPLAALTTAGTFVLRNGIFPGLATPVQVHKGTFNVSRGGARGTFTASLSTLNAQGAVAVANLKNPSADFDITVPDLDVERVRALFANSTSGVGKGGPAPREKGGQVPRENGGARRLLAKGVLKIGRLRARPMEASAVSSRMNVFTDRVSVDSYTMSAYGGTARGAMNIEYTAPRIPAQATAQVSGMNFARVMAALAPGSKWPITGTLEGGGSLSTALATDPLAALTGTGTFAVRNGAIAGLDVKNTLVTIARIAQFVAPSVTKFRYFGGDFRIQQQRVYSNALRLDSEDVQATGRGSSGFNRTLDYTGIADVKTSLFSQPQTQLGLSFLRTVFPGKVPESISDFNARVPYALTGTFENPKFSATGTPQITPLNSPAKPQPQQPGHNPPQIPGIPQLPIKLPPLPFPLGP